MYFNGVVYKLRSYKTIKLLQELQLYIRTYLRLSGVSDEECEDNDKVSM